MHYPITLNLSGRKVLVVGGGKVAERKMTGLVDAAAVITVVAPQVTERVKQFSSAGKVIWRQKAFSMEDLDGAFLIFAATDDPLLNQEIKNAASDHQLVTIADDPEASDFHIPAQLKRGRLNIAVSTGGASPILARKIRHQLEEQFDADYTDYLEFLFQTRQWILQNIDDPALKRKLLEAITSPIFLNSEDREADFLTCIMNGNI